MRLPVKKSMFHVWFIHTCTLFLDVYVVLCLLYLTTCVCVCHACTLIYQITLTEQTNGVTHRRHSASIRMVEYF